MKKQSAVRRRMISGALSMLMVTSILTAIVAVVAEDPTPLIYISGMELRTVMRDVNNDGKEEATIQGLVSLSLKGGSVDKLKSLMVGLEYNSDYLQPSDWETNEPYTNGVQSGTPVPGSLTHLFFHTDEDLYWTGDPSDPVPADPFVWKVIPDGFTPADIGSSAATVRESEAMSLDLTVEQDLKENGRARVLRDGRDPNVTYGAYLDVSGGEDVVLGTLSFHVEKDQVANVIRLFHQTEGIVQDSNGEPKENRLLRISSTKSSDGKVKMTYSLGYYKNIPSLRPPWVVASLTPENLYCKLWFTFVDAILDAEVVRKEVTVNSYQAYTNGEISDLARTLQNYADTVRITRASGAMEDVSMRWGDSAGGGMEFTTVDGAVYRFTWDAAVPRGYTLEKKLDDTTYVSGVYMGEGVYNFTLPGGTADVFTYDRKEGVYAVKQNYAYWENDPLAGKDVLKLHPVPMEVKLTVTPVSLEGIEIDRESLTFRNVVGEIGYTYSSLQLPEEARLSLNATPGTGVVTPIAGVTPVVTIGWNPSTISNVKVESGSPAAVISHWPMNNDDVTNRVGLAIPNDPDVHQADYKFSTFVDRTTIQDSYPWLTVPNASYDLSAVRRIVDDDSAVPPLRSDRFELRAEPVDSDGNLIVDIALKDPDDENGFLDMGSYDVIDLYQPDGVKIDIAWFSDMGAGASYTPQSLTLPWAGNRQGYRIILNTGDRTVGTNAGARESLQRQINLGGWFGAELEKHAGQARTDRIQGYSRPRQNIYIESYTVAPESYVTGSSPRAWFDFTGDRSGLLRVYADGTLSTLVTLPDVDTSAGETEADNWVALRYDAVTGAEPGYIRQFKVDQWANHHDTTLTTASGATLPVTIYGESAAGDAGEPFAGDYIYSSYGRVENPNDVEKVKVRVQKQTENTPATGLDITLTHEQPDGTVETELIRGVNEVKKVIFDDKNEGYTWQQVITLTITNTGTEELHGLYIDGLEDFSYKYAPDGTVKEETNGSCFTILSQPAPNLAVGASTTFQISYVPDLKVLKSDDKVISFEDTTLHVKNDCGTTLRTFTATFNVRREGAYKVNLIVRPDDLSMGSAGFVAGVDANDMYDGMVVGASYTAGSTVWILTKPVDEYALVPKGPYYLSTEQTANVNEPYLDKNGAPILDPVSGNPLYKNYLTEYAPRNLDDNSPTYDTLKGERLYFFTMPESSVTVYVDYFEPLRSKLRLHDLHAYGWENDDARTDTTLWSTDNERPLRELDGENKDVTLFAPSRGAYETIPVPAPTDPNDRKNGSYPVVRFDPQKNEYVVFLEDDDKFCGVSVQLRQLELLMNALEINADIEPTIVMTLNDSAHTQIYNEVGGTKDLGDPTDKKDVNYIHRSMLFAAPVEPGTSKVVTVDVSYNDSSDNYWTGSEGSVTRSYTVRFVRRPEENKGLHTANAGNSPYGMIMNDDAIDGVTKDANGKTRKDLAKEAFDLKDRFTFTSDGLTPAKAYASDGTHLLTNLYWAEAWDGGTNYDKDETALFVYIGQSFDEPGVTNILNSAGELVTTDDLTITFTGGYPLDTKATTLVNKFNSTTPCTPYTLAGDLPVVDGVLDGRPIEAAFANIKDLRPGVYALTYTFPDYKDTEPGPSGDVEVQRYLSFTRPLIILSRRGDVDANLLIDHADGDYIHNRMSDPLPIDPLAGSANYPAGDKLVYRYRIVDANNDRNINNIDANLILRSGSSLQEFYLPTDYANHHITAP